MSPSKKPSEHWELITSWMVPLLFSPEQFPTLPQSILNELWSREDSSVSGSCSHVASSLHDWALTCICVHIQWFLEVFLSPCSDFHDRIGSIFNAELPEGLKVSEKSPETLNILILCPLHDGIFKVLEILVWNSSVTCRHLYIWWTLPL